MGFSCCVSSKAASHFCTLACQSLSRIFLREIHLLLASNVSQRVSAPRLSCSLQLSLHARCLSRSRSVTPDKLQL